MRNVKLWLFGAFIVAACASTMVVVNTSSAKPEGVKTHWRHHDGHWSYWYAPDNRWYYTDGANWFYDNDGAWNVYRFDKDFGREGFERGDYRIPGAEVKIEAPRFRPYRR